MAEHAARIDLSDAGKYGYRSLHRIASEPYEPRYFLDDSLIPSDYGHKLPTAIKDLLDIAGAIMWVDRTTQRSRERMPYAPQRGWSRDLRVTLGVRDVDLWRRPSVKQALEDFLFWLTEDLWDLEFVTCHGMRRHSDLQQPLFSSSSHEYLIVLYSGGLDSLAGAVRLLVENPERGIVLMSAVHNRQRLRQVINAQVMHLRRRFGEDRVRFAPLPFHVVNRPTRELIAAGAGKSMREEHTQRTRGFLFLAFAAAVAAALDARRMLICENGVGAINLPMDWCQLGSQNTRAVHPRTIALMTDLLHLIGQSQMSYEAPFTFSTKAELCTVLDDPALNSLVRLTVSCDGFPHRFTKTVTDAELHCGWCTSCLLRRQAIHAAGLSAQETPSYYRFDLCSPLADFKPSFFEPLKKMLDQAYLFEQAASSPRPGQALSERFPELLDAALVIQERPHAFGLVSGLDALTALADLLVRYAREWPSFPYVLRSNLSFGDAAS